MLIQLAGPPSMGFAAAIVGSAVKATQVANEAARKIYPVGHVMTWPDGTQSVMGPQGWNKVVTQADGTQFVTGPGGGAVDPATGQIVSPAGAAPVAPGAAQAGMAGPVRIAGLTRPALVWLAIAGLLIVGGGIYFARR